MSEDAAIDPTEGPAKGSAKGSEEPSAGDDARLVARWRDGDRVACKALFERYYPNVARFFRTKVRDFAIAEDLVHETFLRCFEAIPRLRERAAFRSFLFGIACNTLREHYRGARRELERGALESRSVRELAGADAHQLISALARREEQRALLEALRRIPLEHQVLLELRYWERMTGPEMAAIVGAPLGTVKTRLRRARALLEEQLRALAANQDVLKSTLTDLDRWAAELRDQLT